MDWQSILRLARNIGASDVHFSTGETPWLRLDGRMLRLQAFNAQASPQVLRLDDLSEHLVFASSQRQASDRLNFITLTLPSLCPNSDAFGSMRFSKRVGRPWFCD
jgi:Tfp pilus assembly pilus retraction ATPase PilT